MDFSKIFNGNFEDILRNLAEVSFLIDIFWYLLLVYVLSSFFYWLGSRFINKRRNDTFDGWFLITVLTMGWGRLAYIISNWDQFINYFWFYLPYERYGDQVYLLRAMPWKLLTIWDGGFLFTAMLVAFMVGVLLFVVILKKWSVREMSGPVAISISAMLGGIFISYGWLLPESEFSKIIIDNGLIIAAGALLITIFNSVLATGDHDKSLRRFLIRDYVNLAYLTLFSILAFQTFHSTEISFIDNINLWIYAVLALAFVVLGFLRFNEKAREVPTGLHTSTPTRNRAIKSKMFQSR